MKKNIIITLSFLLLGLTAFSQTQDVGYYYDSKGNRIERVITLPESKSELAPEDLIFEEKLEEYKLTVYPNPTLGELKVELSGILNFEGSYLSIHSLNGTLIQKIEPVKSTNNLNLKNQAPGIYILRIVIGGKLQTWKIIKR